MAYDRIEPIGGDRGDLQAGIVAATVMNSQRGKGSKVFTPLDFMPLVDKPKVETKQAWQDQLAIMKRISAAHNRRILRQGATEAKPAT